MNNIMENIMEAATKVKEAVMTKIEVHGGVLAALAAMAFGGLL